MLTLQHAFHPVRIALYHIPHLTLLQVTISYFAMCLTFLSARFVKPFRLRIYLLYSVTLGLGSVNTYLTFLSARLGLESVNIYLTLLFSRLGLGLVNIYLTLLSARLLAALCHVTQRPAIIDTLVHVSLTTLSLTAVLLRTTVCHPPCHLLTLRIT